MWQAPFIVPDQTIQPDWIDYNGHLNMAFYNVLFDRGVDHLYDALGIGEAYVRDGAGSCFTLEVHLNYLDELTLEDQVSVALQLIDYDAKRLHYFLTMTNSSTGALAATSENLALQSTQAPRQSNCICRLPASDCSKSTSDWAICEFKSGSNRRS